VTDKLSFPDPPFSADFGILDEMPEFGTCDDPMCDVQYDLSDFEDHCPECGTCYEHCPENHTAMSIKALRDFMLTADDL
jgi:ferredoxin